MKKENPWNTTHARSNPWSSVKRLINIKNKLLPKEVCQDTNRTKPKENLHLKVGTDKTLDIVQMRFCLVFIQVSLYYKNQLTSLKYRQCVVVCRCVNISSKAGCEPSERWWPNGHHHRQVRTMGQCGLQVTRTTLNKGTVCVSFT